MGRYDKITDAYYQGLMASVGYRRKDIDKPLIGIVNSWNDVNPGHKPFKELAQYVKEGIWAAGGTPAEFGVPAPCDGMSQMLGMQYVLPQRDMIAASAEAMARAHHFDGMVFLCSCDKNRPRHADVRRSPGYPSLGPHRRVHDPLPDPGTGSPHGHQRPEGIHRGSEGRTDHPGAVPGLRRPCVLFLRDLFYVRDCQYHGGLCGSIGALPSRFYRYALLCL